ncbi:hypothetical protein M0R45_015055 [Rubus argutus]|uniref:Uncharacterized protein n=1 Tax=Rubus argutus TaxID=59490 RepID=A0AAW1XQK1_RUBAR
MPNLQIQGTHNQPSSSQPEPIHLSLGAQPPIPQPVGKPTPPRRQRRAFLFPLSLHPLLPVAIFFVPTSMLSSPEPLALDLTPSPNRRRLQLCLHPHCRKGLLQSSTAAPSRQTVRVAHLWPAVPALAAEQTEKKKKI